MDDDDEMLRVMCTVELREDTELAEYAELEEVCDPMDPTELMGLIQNNGSSTAPFLASG